MKISHLLAIAFLIGTAALANAQVTVYNNIPNPLPLNVFSQGPEAYAFTEMGDGLNLAPGGDIVVVPGLTTETHVLNTVTVVLQSWACQSGVWYNPSGPNACVSTAGATHNIPVTVNIYAVKSAGTSLEGNPAPTPGTLLATATQTFQMPYRPSSDFVNCPASPAQASSNYYQWYDATTQTCQDGIDFPITFDLSSLYLQLPNKIIVTFSFNTTSYGPNPKGTGTACFGTIAGCFYDGLNFSGFPNSAAYPGAILAPSAGSVLNVNGIYMRFPSGGPNSNFCGTGPVSQNILALDASPGCYTGNHPLIQVTVQ